MKVTNSKDIEDEYKEDNLQALNSNEIFINNTEDEELLIEHLMSMNFPL